MPSKSTILAWLSNESEFQKEFQDQYARARMAQAYGWADEILEIADDGRNDTYVEKGETRTDHDVINRSRLRVDTRKWLLSKLLPKEYGDRDSQEPAQNKSLKVVIERGATRKSQQGKDDVGSSGTEG